MTIPEAVVWGVAVAVGSGLIGGAISIAVLRATKVSEKDCTDKRNTCRGELFGEIKDLRGDVGDIKEMLAGLLAVVAPGKSKGPGRG